MGSLFLYVSTPNHDGYTLLLLIASDAPPITDDELEKQCRSPVPGSVAAILTSP